MCRHFDIFFLGCKLLLTLSIGGVWIKNGMAHNTRIQCDCQHQISNVLCSLRNRPLHGFRRHLGCGAVTAKITANVWDIVQLSTSITLQLYIGFSQKRRPLKGIYMEII